MISFWISYAFLFGFAVWAVRVGRVALTVGF